MSVELITNAIDILSHISNRLVLFMLKTRDVSFPGYLNMSITYAVDLSNWKIMQTSRHKPAFSFFYSGFDLPSWFIRCGALIFVLSCYNDYQMYEQLLILSSKT